MDYSFIARIKSFGAEKEVWQFRKVIEVEYISDDNSTKTMDVDKAEAEVMMVIKMHLKGVIKDSVLKTLCEKIEDYGQKKYEDGAFDESYSNSEDQ